MRVDPRIDPMIEMWRAVLWEFVKDLESTNNEERDYAITMFEAQDHEHREQMCFLANVDEAWLQRVYRSGALQRYVASKGRSR